LRQTRPPTLTTVQAPSSLGMIFTAVSALLIGRIIC
jgi:hypothetical protein